MQYMCTVKLQGDHTILKLQGDHTILKLKGDHIILKLKGDHTFYKIQGDLDTCAVSNSVELVGLCLNVLFNLLIQNHES